MSVDIWSRGAVLREVRSRHAEGKTRDCRFLEITRGYLDAYFVQCSQEFADRENGHNTPTNLTGYTAPSVYNWPLCPIDCPLYEQDAAFEISLARGRKQVPTPLRTPPFVDPARLEELRQLQPTHFDLTKLLRLCSELNQCWTSGSHLAIPLLVRAILDHIPPVFGFRSFNEVAINYSGQSFKGAMPHLNSSLRAIADGNLHIQIHETESLPTPTQVNFAPDLDVLLQEVVRLLRK